MNNFSNKLLYFLEKNSRKLLWIFIAVYIIFFSIICILKYNNFLYNSLDLSIINNVFYNTLHGDLFHSSIQGHSYLGDHFTPIIFLLLPLYAIYQSPITLLVLQTIFLALAAWPLYKISQIILKDKIFPLLISLLWLINPLVHNINLFEFHFISLLPFFFLWTFYFYLKTKSNPKNKKLFLYFLISIFLCLLIREDIIFILLIFGIIILLSKPKNYQLLAAYCLLLITYGLLAFKIISLNSSSNFSPFLYYYSWILNNPSNLFAHLFTLANLEMILGLLIAFLFIPLLKPKYLLLCLMPFMQIVLSAAGGGALVWQLHYSALFLPGLIISFIYGLKKVSYITQKQLKSKYMVITILIITDVFLLFTLGPLKGIKDIYNPNIINTKKIISNIPADSSIMVNYDYLSNLSSGKDIYSLHYYFLGQQQFGTQNYVLEKNPEYILINFDDLINYDLHLAQLDWSKENYKQGYQRLQNLLKNYGIVEISDNTALFKKDYLSQTKLYTINKQPMDHDQKIIANFDDKIKLIDYKILPITHYTLPITLTFQALNPLSNNYYLKIEYNNQSKFFPLAYIYPASQWQTNEIITATYWLPTKKDFNNTGVYIRLVKLKGGVEIDDLRNTKLVIDDEIQIGERIKLNN
ncbi:MAG: DUF2079 domain-containing protein [Patescibacteria group bacterium]